MTHPLGILLTCSVIFCGLSAGLVFLLWENQRVVVLAYSFTALALCLAPAVATMLWIHWSAIHARDQRLVVALGGSGLRMLFVLGSGWLLNGTVEFFGRRSFLLWLLVMYLFVLGLEIFLLIRSADSEVRATPRLSEPEA